VDDVGGGVVEHAPHDVDQAALAEDENPLLWRVVICVEVSHAGASMRGRHAARVLAACCGGARRSL